MIKFDIKLFIVSLLVLIAIGCDDEFNDKTYKGPVLVEFAEGENGSSGVYLGDGGQVIQDAIRTQLVGPHQGSDITMQFEIDPGSTGIAGVHYNLITTGQFVIAAGSSIGEIQFEVITDNFVVGEVFTLVINITGGDVPVSENLKSITHTMEIACSSDLAGTYNSVMDGDFGDGTGGSAATYAGLTATVLLEEGGSGGIYSFDDMSFGLYPQGYTDTAPIGRIEDLCGNVSDLGDTDRFGDPFTITGTVNADGTLSISWRNTWGDTGTGVLTRQ